MRRLIVLIAALMVAVIGAAIAVPQLYARLAAPGTRTAQVTGQAATDSLQRSVNLVPTPITLRFGPVTVNQKTQYFSWALLDRKTGKLEGRTPPTATNSTESMIKVWLVSDFLRRIAEANRTPSDQDLKTASTAIRDSNDYSASSLYKSDGGDASIKRLVKTCGLTDTKLVSGKWAYTQMSARDAVRMGACVADGRAAGPKWTEWVLNEMRNVQGGVADQPPGYCCTGGGHWGIIDGVPKVLAPKVSIKNGWTPLYADGLWHINCLAIHDRWILAVQTRYPISLGLQNGADICSSVAQQVIQIPGAQ